MGHTLSLLNAWLAECRGREYRPGKWDCALFAAGWVERLTGRDPARGWRGYRTLTEGQRKLETAGHADHVALAAAELQEIGGWMKARTGDIAVVGDCFGIVGVDRVHVLRPRGLDVVPLERAERVFRA